MLNRPDLFSDIAAALESRRWIARADPDGIAFILDEAVTGGVIQIRLLFNPEQMWHPPQATLKVVGGEPKAFKLHHFGSWFCYLNHESVEWDPESPEFVGHVVWAADRAVEELHRLQKGERITNGDAEFVVHWAGSRVHLDIEDGDWPPALDSKLEQIDLERPEYPGANALAVYRVKNAATENRYAAYGEQSPKSIVPLVVANLENYPFPCKTAWPPKSLADLNQWLIAHHPKEGKALWRSIANAIFSGGRYPSNVFVLLSTLAGRYGALLITEGNALNGFRRGAALAQSLHGNNQLTRAIEVSRVTFERLDNDFVLGRNAPEQRAVLAGKKIHLLGAGAVGSQLADLLVQAGAGICGGELVTTKDLRTKPRRSAQQTQGGCAAQPEALRTNPRTAARQSGQVACRALRIDSPFSSMRCEL